MDFVQIMLIIGAVAGIVMIAVSFTGPREKKPELEDMRAPRGYVMDKKLEAMDSTISEADNVISELGGISQNVLKEMDNKYNELLFLYNLIDEKEKGIKEKGAGQTGRAQDSPGVPVMREDYDAPEGYVTARASRERPAANAAPERKKPFDNPRLPEIMELKDKGFSVAQIAKELNMGYGEVSLILSLKQM